MLPLCMIGGVVLSLGCWGFVLQPEAILINTPAVVLVALHCSHIITNLEILLRLFKTAYDFVEAIVSQKHDQRWLRYTL